VDERKQITKLDKTVNWSKTKVICKRFVRYNERSTCRNTEQIKNNKS
jgi:hypothetical protein